VANPAIHKVQSVGMEFAKLLEEIDINSYDEKEFNSLMQVADRVHDDLTEIYDSIEEDEDEGEGEDEEEA